MTSLSQTPLSVLDLAHVRQLRRLTALSEDGHEAIRQVTPDVIRVASQKRSEAEVIKEIRRRTIPSRLSRLRKK